MSDDIDKAVDLGEKLHEARVNQIRAAAQRRELHPIGTCHYCRGQVTRGRLFCDSICTEDYENEQEALKRNGTE